MTVFSPGEFDALLNDLGQAAEWRRSQLCPCRSLESGAPRQGCPNCRGRGVFWAEAVPAMTALAGARSQREWASHGLWESGDVVLTIPSDSPFYETGENDRLTLLANSEPFQIVKRRSATVYLDFRILSISRAIWEHPSTHAIVEATAPTQMEDGSLAWDEEDDTAPPDGAQFSLTGRRRPEYWIFKDFPQDRAHQGGARLPRRVVARRFDLFGRGLARPG